MNALAMRIAFNGVREAAEASGLRPHHIRQALASGELQSHAVARRTMVLPLSEIALMFNPAYDSAATQRSIDQVRVAAKRLGITVGTATAAQPDQIERAFSWTQDLVEGVIVHPDPMFFNERRRIAQLALKRKIPTSVFASPMVEDGSLMSYAPSIQAIFRRVAVYIDKILKGAKPAELPVELPTKFDFDVNLKTAKAIGLTISPTILALADKVIE